MAVYLTMQTPIILLAMLVFNFAARNSPSACPTCVESPPLSPPSTPPPPPPIVPPPTPLLCPPPVSSPPALPQPVSPPPSPSVPSPGSNAAPPPPNPILPYYPWYYMSPPPPGCPCSATTLTLSTVWITSLIPLVLLS